MAVTEAQKRARDKWNAKFADVKLRIPKEQKEQIQEYAANRGESVNGFICRVVAEAMEQEK